MLRATTDLSPDELAPMLEQWGPWRLEIEFSNGLNTTDFGVQEPFIPEPLGKILRVGAAVDLEEFRGGRAIDIGYNIGYNTIYLAETYDMSVTGVDIGTRHKEVAEFLLGATTLADQVEFVVGDATTFTTPEPVDLVLHFGTLYHLPNPLLAVETTARNLRPGGLLALETQIYIGEDQTLSKYINGFMGDDTNFWALSRQTLRRVLTHYGFVDIEVLFETEPDYIGHDMARIILIARRAA